MDTIANPWNSSASAKRRAAHRVDDCTDLVRFPAAAHNEDGGASDAGQMMLVDVKIDGGQFIAFCYPGDLPTGAFGWNSNHIGFTLNYVAPYTADIKGMGRGFISRDLLAASSLADATARVTTRTPQATGHNYQLYDFEAGRALAIETAPFGKSSIVNLTNRSELYYHTNIYHRLDVTQPLDPSSTHREVRRRSEHAL